jgi:WD40 repeat protein
VDSLERVTELASEILSETFKMAFSEEGEFLVCGEENDVRLFDLAKPERSRTFAGHTSPVMSVAYAPDGQTLATTSVDHTVKLWNLESNQEVATLSGHRGPVSGLAFSHGGDMLVSTSEDKTIRIWRAGPLND